MLSLREVEFQFWEQFSHLEEEEDDDYDDNIECDSYQTINSASCKQKRLNRADMTLYGSHLDHETFAVVTCYKCGMVLKQQAFHDHVKKRHNSFSLSDESNYSSDDTSNSLDNNSVIPSSFETKQRVKRLRTDDNSPNIESNPSKILLRDDSCFLKPKPYKSHKNVIKRGPQKSGCQQIKLKLRKSDHGMWSVAAI